MFALRVDQAGDALRRGVLPQADRGVLARQVVDRRGEVDRGEDAVETRIVDRALVGDPHGD